MFIFFQFKLFLPLLSGLEQNQLKKAICLYLNTSFLEPLVLTTPSGAKSPKLNSNVMENPTEVCLITIYRKFLGPPVQGYSGSIQIISFHTKVDDNYF